MEVPQCSISCRHSAAVAIETNLADRVERAADEGKIPLVLELLSPAHRPVQVTRDLAGFWKGSYADVKKDLKGRYPKHRWPDDPLAATPTTRAKRPGEQD